MPVLTVHFQHMLLNIWAVIPITAHQDTIGPITRTVKDAAIVLNIIAGKDPKDNGTLAQPNHLPDFTRALNKHALRGKRFGVPRQVFLEDSATGNDPFVNIAFNDALKLLKKLGATIVDPADLPSAPEIPNALVTDEFLVFEVDFKVLLNSGFAAWS